jgi:hypothetical protein
MAQEKDKKKNISDIPHKDKESKVHEFALIDGNVLGYADGNYTRPLANAQVILIVHVFVKDSSGKQVEELYPIVESSMKELHDKHPDIYDTIIKNSDRFKAVETGEDGYFKFEKIPIGYWCYIVCAYVGVGNEIKWTIHTDEMGNDGKGGRMRIMGDSLRTDPERHNVVVGFPDKWFIISEPKKDDPKWEPSDFRPGMKED